MLSLMQSNDGYGDDFAFNKRKCINVIESEHSAMWDLDTSYSRYASYEYDNAVAKFVTFNKDYFKHLFSSLRRCCRCRCINSTSPRNTYTRPSIRATIPTTKRSAPSTVSVKSRSDTRRPRRRPYLKPICCPKRKHGRSASARLFVPYRAARRLCEHARRRRGDTKCPRSSSA